MNMTAPSIRAMPTTIKTLVPIPPVAGKADSAANAGVASVNKKLKRVTESKAAFFMQITSCPLCAVEHFYLFTGPNKTNFVLLGRVKTFAGGEVPLPQAFPKT